MGLTLQDTAHDGECFFSWICLALGVDPSNLLLRQRVRHAICDFYVSNHSCYLSLSLLLLSVWSQLQIFVFVLGIFPSQNRNCVQIHGVIGFTSCDSLLQHSQNLRDGNGRHRWGTDHELYLLTRVMDCRIQVISPSCALSFFIPPFIFSQLNFHYIRTFIRTSLIS